MRSGLCVLYTLVDHSLHLRYASRIAAKYIDKHYAAYVNIIVNATEKQLTLFEHCIGRIIYLCICAINFQKNDKFTIALHIIAY